MALYSIDAPLNDPQPDQIEYELGPCTMSCSDPDMVLPLKEPFKDAIKGNPRHSTEDPTESPGDPGFPRQELLFQLEQALFLWLCCQGRLFFRTAARKVLGAPLKGIQGHKLGIQ